MCLLGNPRGVFFQSISRRAKNSIEAEKPGPSTMVSDLTGKRRDGGLDEPQDQQLKRRIAETQQLQNQLQLLLNKYQTQLLTGGRREEESLVQYRL
jgi:hypothetical protein